MKKLNSELLYIYRMEFICITFILYLFIEHPQTDMNTEKSKVDISNGSWLGNPASSHEPANHASFFLTSLFEHVYN